MQLTAHARARSIQRSVPHHVVETIVDFGRPTHSRGALSIVLDRQALALAASELDCRDVIRLERYLGVYVIADGAAVITVARSIRHRPTRRQRR